MLYWLTILVRLIFGPLILIWPFPSIIVSFFLDVVDGDLAPRAVTKKKYQIIDKTTDTWVYVFEMILGWQMFPVFKYLLLFLFIWRLVGIVLFSFTKKSRVFFIFGNYFENIFYVLFFQNYLPKINIYYLFVLVTLIKIFQEWFIHIAKLSFMEDIIGKKRKWRDV